MKLLPKTLVKRSILTISLNFIIIFNLSISTQEINNLLINDLNIIATKIDEIPETSLNLKLILLAYECNDIKLNWKISQNTKQEKNKKLNVIKQDLSNKIFGFQVVVREYLEPIPGKESNFNSDEKPEKLKEKTLRVYSSKFIDSHQNKFKLVNLLRRDTASYLICLIIYMDVTETVAFEKQCVTFSLPTIGTNLDSGCSKGVSGKNKNTKTTTSDSMLVSPLPKTSNLTVLNDSPLSLNESETSDFNNINSNLEQDSKSFQLKRTNISRLFQHNCEHVSQCKHYSNLIIAFVICGILLATNIFMFTVIIIQNTIKLSLLKHKINLLKENPKLNNSNSENRELTDKSFLNANSDINKWFKIKSALCISFSDFMKLICCGLFKTNSKTNNNINKNQKGDETSKFENFSIPNEAIYDTSVSQTCTTITRPGYILQVPNSIPTESVISTSDMTSCSSKNRESNKMFKKAERRKISKKEAKKRLDLSIKNLNNNYPPNITQQHMNNFDTESSSYIGNGMNRNMENNNFDNEIFFHVQNRVFGHQISSAF